MKAARFDTMIRALAAKTRGRRAILRLATGGVLGALLGWPAVEEAAACRKDKRPCKRSRQCCSGVCRRGRCHCPRKLRCGGVCCRQGDVCADKSTETCVTGRGTCKKTVSRTCTETPRTIECNDNPNCLCVKTAEGTVRCGVPISGENLTCCNNSAECEAFFAPAAPGAFCSQSARFCGLCGPEFGSKGTCALPCSVFEDIIEG